MLLFPLLLLLGQMSFQARPLKSSNGIERKKHNVHFTREAPWPRPVAVTVLHLNIELDIDEMFLFAISETNRVEIPQLNQRETIRSHKVQLHIC